MMDECLPDDRLGELLDTAAGDGRRAHLDACPRCRARLAAFRAFMEMEPLPEGAEVSAARARLASALCQAIAADPPRGGMRVPDPVPDPVARAGASEAGERRGFFPRWRFGFGWSSAVGLAAVTALVLLVRTIPDFRAEREIVLRGPAGLAPAAPAVSSAVRADGSVELRWPRGLSDDQYRILVFDETLRELARWDVGPLTSRVLGPADLRALGPSGAAVFWRVAVIRGGDEISLSAPATFRLP